MEQINDKWWKDTDNNRIVIGLTQRAIERLGVIWHMVPRMTDKMERGVPFLNIESSRSLCPLMSPINGTIVSWNNAVLENPDRLTEETWIVEVQE